MKKLFLILLVLGAISHEMFAQAPQAICYQAIAKDDQGNNMIDSEITIRIAILIGGPLGDEEWVEVHDPKTDQFGLFSIEIGTGQRVDGNQANFDDINWGFGLYWLQVEMDALGGNNFQMMGVNQIISVPYALYANEAGHALEADHAIYADSAGLAGLADVALYANEAGHALEADHALAADTAAVAGHADTADEAGYADQAGTAAVADVALKSDTALVAQTSIISLYTQGDDDGDPTNEIQSLAYQNDTLYIKDANGNYSGSGIFLTADDADADPSNELQELFFQNDSLFLQNPDGSMNGNGVLLSQVDADSTNELQTLTLEDGILSISGGNEIELQSSSLPFAAIGSSYDLPQGMIGEHIVIGSGNFQVPQGKNFYITAAGPTVTLKGYGPPPSVEHPTTPNMPTFPPGTSIEDCHCTGILIDVTSNVQPVVIDFVTGSSSYTVPAGKILFIKSGMKNDQLGWLVIDDEPMEFLRSNFTRGTRIITIPEGKVVEPLPINQNGDVDMILTGFLIDIDF